MITSKIPNPASVDPAVSPFYAKWQRYLAATKGSDLDNAELYRIIVVKDLTARIFGIEFYNACRLVEDFLRSGQLTAEYLERRYGLTNFDMSILAEIWERLGQEVTYDERTKSWTAF